MQVNSKLSLLIGQWWQMKGCHGSFLDLQFPKSFFYIHYLFEPVQYLLTIGTTISRRQVRGVKLTFKGLTTEVQKANVCSPDLEPRASAMTPDTTLCLVLDVAFNFLSHKINEANGQEGRF